MAQYCIPGLDKEGNYFFPNQNQFNFLLEGLKSFTLKQRKNLRPQHVYWFLSNHNKYRKLIRVAPDIYTRSNLQRTLDSIIQTLPSLYNRAYRTQYDWKDDTDRKFHEQSVKFCEETVKDAFALACCIQCYDNIIKSPV